MHFFSKKFAYIKNYSYLCTVIQKTNIINNKNLNIMKTIYCIGYYSTTTNGCLFYCFNMKQGAFLSKDINQAATFMSIESARHDAPLLMKYFWAYPINFTIFKGTKKNNI